MQDNVQNQAAEESQDMEIQLSNIDKPDDEEIQDAQLDRQHQSSGLADDAPKIEQRAPSADPASTTNSVSFDEFSQAKAFLSNTTTQQSHQAEIAEAFAAFNPQPQTSVTSNLDAKRFVAEIEQQQITYRAPRAVGPEWSADQFRDELMEILCAKEPQGAVSNHLLALYNQSQEETPNPPGLAEILRQISGDSSYSAERRRFLKACRHNSRFSINSSFSQMQQGQDFSLMADLGDIIAHYGSETGFQCVCPLQAQQKAAQELQEFFTSVIPRTCMGYTLTFVQASHLLEDIFVAQFFTSTELQAHFARALFIQTKFILDYCEHNPARHPAATRALNVTSYDCFEYRSDAVPDKREFKVQSTSGRNLCYVGVLQFLCLIQKTLIEKYRPGYLRNVQGMAPERPRAVPNEDPSYEEADDVAERIARENRAREIPVIRDPFSTVRQIDPESARPASSAKATAWKIALSFGAFLDCYLLRFAKRFGIQVANKPMQKGVADFPEAAAVFAQFTQQLKQKFALTTQGAELATRTQLCKLMSPLKTSPVFIDEYVLRNYTRTDKAFKMGLTFEEFANCLFVAANLKFSVHPWLARYPAPADRLRYAAELLLGWKK